MKNARTKIIAFLISFCCITISNAQLINFNSITAGSNQYSQTDANKSTEAIVVGDFAGNSVDPRAALNVNTNFLSGLVSKPPSYGSFGEVFRTDAPNGTNDVNIFSFWRMYTGAQSSEIEHLAIFNSHSWSIIPSYYNDINFRASSGNMFFWTENQNDAKAQKRMMINSDSPTNLDIHGVDASNAVDPNWNTNGYVGIGYNNDNMWDVESGGTGPWSMLHIEGPNNYPWNGDGWRSWMRTGAFIQENSDNVFLGLRSVIGTENRSDAVLSWGDDEYMNDLETPADVFKMVFTGFATSGNGDFTGTLNNPKDYEGREVMRMTAQGRMGIGPLFSPSAPPAVRLEILDMINTNLEPQNEAQLRLTYTQGSSYTDFQTTSAGELYINPTSGHVGINTNNPDRALNLETGVAPTSATESGLKFNNLTTASTVGGKPFRSRKQRCFIC